LCDIAQACIIPNDCLKSKRVGGQRHAETKKITVNLNHGIKGRRHSIVRVYASISIRLRGGEKTGVVVELDVLSLQECNWTLCLDLEVVSSKQDVRKNNSWNLDNNLSLFLQLFLRITLLFDSRIDLEILRNGINSYGSGRLSGLKLVLEPKQYLHKCLNGLQSTSSSKASLKHLSQLGIHVDDEWEQAI